MAEAVADVVATSVTAGDVDEIDTSDKNQSFINQSDTR